MKVVYPHVYLCLNIKKQKIMKKLIVAVVFMLSGMSHASENHIKVEVEDRLSREEYMKIGAEKAEGKPSAFRVIFVKKGKGYNEVARYTSYRGRDPVLRTTLLSREDYQKMLKPVPDTQNKGYFWQWMDPLEVSGGGGKKYAFYEHEGKVYVDVFRGFDEKPHRFNGDLDGPNTPPSSVRIRKEYNADGTTGTRVVFSSTSFGLKQTERFAFIGGRVFKVAHADAKPLYDEYSRRLFQIGYLGRELAIIQR